MMNVNSARRAGLMAAAAVTAALALGAAGGLAWKQEPAPRPEGRGPGRPGTSPVFAALDGDHDGTVSDAELAGAPAALKTLDRNKDGTLSVDEIRPSFGPGGREGRGPRGGGGRGGPGEAPATSPDDLAATLMGFDKDSDGKLTRAEVPDRLQGLFDRADADKDNTLTADELKKSATSMANPSARGPGEGREGEGRRGRGPGGGPSGRDPLVTMLDADRDGTISAGEVSAAPSALRSLDTDGDGQLTPEEVRPSGRGRGDRRRPF
jgi:Ca2+-binding EF-hand superfamily protein